VTNTGEADVPRGEVVVYQAPDGEVRVDVRLERETVWLTQAQMAELFGRERSVVTKHIRNAFQEGELDSGATSAKFAQVRTEGGRSRARSITTTSMGSSRSATASSHCAARSSGSGRRPPCASTYCAATR
jgi:hypothetical protein